jgi:hypothetical protein
MVCGTACDIGLWQIRHYSSKPSYRLISPDDGVNVTLGKVRGQVHSRTEREQQCLFDSHCVFHGRLARVCASRGCNIGGWGELGMHDKRSLTTQPIGARTTRTSRKLIRCEVHLRRRARLRRPSERSHRLPGTPAATSPQPGPRRHSPVVASRPHACSIEPHTTPVTRWRRASEQPSEAAIRVGHGPARHPAVPTLSCSNVTTPTD